MPAQFESKNACLPRRRAAGGAAEAIAFSWHSPQVDVADATLQSYTDLLVRRPRQTELGAEIIVRTVVIRSGGMAMAHSFRFALLLSAGLAVPAASQVSGQAGTSNGSISSAPTSTTTSIGSAATPSAPTTVTPQGAASSATATTGTGVVGSISPGFATLGSRSAAPGNASSGSINTMPTAGGISTGTSAGNGSAAASSAQAPVSRIPLWLLCPSGVPDAVSGTSCAP